MTLQPDTAPVKMRVLDFDLETLAAGFADPQWVPQKIMVSAWSWIGEDIVHSAFCGPMGFFDPVIRAESLVGLLDAIDEADMVTGHNLLRFDLPVLNAECLRMGLSPLEPILVQDTMRLPKTKGFKKGQDNVSELLDVPIKKQAMSWQEWEQAYEEDGWKTAISRCTSDVAAHKIMRATMLDRGWLKTPTMWRP